MWRRCHRFGASLPSIVVHCGLRFSSLLHINVERHKYAISFQYHARPVFASL
jgi:hypothetical protein